MMKKVYDKYDFYNELSVEKRYVTIKEDYYLTLTTKGD
jgi:hypothetical protein